MNTARISTALDANTSACGDESNSNDDNSGDPTTTMNKGFFHTPSKHKESSYNIVPARTWLRYPQPLPPVVGRP